MGSHPSHHHDGRVIKSKVSICRATKYTFHFDQSCRDTLPCKKVCLKVQKWRQTGTKVTFHPPENLFWSQMKGTRSDILQGQALFRGVKQGKKKKRKKRKKEKKKKRKKEKKKKKKKKKSTLR